MCIVACICGVAIGAFGARAGAARKIAGLILRLLINGRRFNKSAAEKLWAGALFWPHRYRHAKMPAASKFRQLYDVIT